MALLDRFRSVPAQKHLDPEVRLQYVESLTIDDREPLAALAREDESPRVRRAAIGKLIDPATLALVARGDADPGVRGDAVAMLRDIALEAFEETGEAEALAAIEALPDPKILAVVAKTTTRETVAAQALARLSEPRALGSVARHAPIESVRRQALDSLQEEADIMAVAMNGRFKDTSVLAVERLTHRASLEEIAAGSHNKHAMKRARGLLRDMDERAALEIQPEASPERPDDRPVSEEDTHAREREADLRAEADAAAARERARLHEQQEREREERLAAARAADEAAAEEARKRAARRRERLVELVTEIEAAAADEDVRAASRRQALVAREWRDLTKGDGPDEELAQRYAAADLRVTERDRAAKDEDRRSRHDALARLTQWLARTDAVAANPQLTAKAAERALRDLRAALADVPPLPSKADHDEMVRRVKAAQAVLTPKLQELRELEEWQRWANVGIQEQLCEKMEGLASETSPEEIARRIRDLQQQWRLASDVPRAQGEALWRRFKQAHDTMWARCTAHFAAEAQRRADNLQKKLALCARAEEAAVSTNWIQTADAIKAMQAEWKTIGPAPRSEERVVWERFRAACDRFFTRRHEDLAARKAAWAANLARKEALCEQAEALAVSTDWDAAAAEVRRLQAEWKTIGAVKKTRSEAIWQRFRSACDAFFSRYAQRHEIARGERVAAREAICAELESLESDEDLLAKVRALRTRWQQEVALRGVEPAQAAALDDRCAAAVDRVREKFAHVFADTDLDPDANHRRMEALVARMEELAASLGGPSAAGQALPPAKLAEMLKQALASNTIGGKTDRADRLRAAQEEVRQAQANWARLGAVSEPARRAMSDRFARAMRQIADAARAAGAAGPARSPR